MIVREGGIRGVGPYQPAAFIGEGETDPDKNQQAKGAHTEKQKKPVANVQRDFTESGAPAPS